MAGRGEDIYGKYGIYGRDAYDFKTTGNEIQGEYGSSIKMTKAEKTNFSDKPSPAMSIACLLCAVLLFTGLMFRSSLIILSQETVAVQEEIEELLDEQTMLKIRHEMAFSLAETEEYAIDVLGMRKPVAAQVSCVDIVEGTEETLADEAREEKKFLSIIRAYFSG